MLALDKNRRIILELLLETKQRFLKSRTGLPFMSDEFLESNFYRLIDRDGVVGAEWSYQLLKDMKGEGLIFRYFVSGEIVDTTLYHNNEITNFGYSQYLRSKRNNEYLRFEELFFDCEFPKEVYESDFSYAREILIQAFRTISDSELSQAEKSQILGLLRLCEDTLSLPSPKASILENCIKYLRSVDEIADLIQKVWERLFG